MVLLVTDDTAERRKCGTISNVKHWLFTFLSALSLLVCIGLGYLWVRSTHVFDGVKYTRPSQLIWLSTNPRGLTFGMITMWGDDVRFDGIGWEYGTTRNDPENPYFEAPSKEPWLGFKWKLGGDSRAGPRGYPIERNPTCVAMVPFWFPMALTTVLPLFWLRGRMRQRQRIRHGLCLDCGYDLRATPDPIGSRLPRCPECGRDRSESTKPDSAIRS